MSDDLKVALMAAMDAAHEQGNWREHVIKALLLEEARTTSPTYRVTRSPSRPDDRFTVRVQASFNVVLQKDITVSRRAMDRTRSLTSGERDSMIDVYIKSACREMGVDTEVQKPLAFDYDRACRELQQQRERRAREEMYRVRVRAIIEGKIDPSGPQGSQTVGQFVSYDQATGRWTPADSDSAEGIVVQAEEGGAIVQVFEQ